MDQSSSLSGQWQVIINSTIALVVGNGPVLLFTFGVFLKPIAEQMDWPRGTMSLGVAIALTFAGLMTPLVGQFIDRWGVQRVLLFSITDVRPERRCHFAGGCQRCGICGALCACRSAKHWPGAIALCQSYYFPFRRP